VSSCSSQQSSVNMDIMESMSDKLDILIKLEFPTLGDFDWGLGNYILTEQFHPSDSSEVIFRFSYDKSIIRYGLGAISALFLPKLSFQYEESPKKKTDYDISSLWNTLVQQYNQPTTPVSNKGPEIPWVEQSRLAIEKGDAELSKSGVGGTYFVHNNVGENISVFKPVDEEPGGPNNPKKDTKFVPMLPWGTGAHREVAASRFGSFAGVPETHFVEAGTKFGSLQKYIPNDGDCSEYGSNKFSDETVHRLGLFDICVLNMDRNDENLLVQKTEADWRLIPIDHTYCFPSKIDSYFTWQYWPQAKRPFSTETLDFISSINVVASAQLFLDTGIDEASVRNVMVASLLVQKAAAAGFNLFQIASMVSGKENQLVDILAKTKNREEYFVGKPLYSLSTQMQKLILFKNICEKEIDEFLHLEVKVVY